MSETAALSDNEIQFALQHLDRFAPEEKQRILGLFEERDKQHRLELQRTSFIDFVKAVWPGFIPGAHHTLIAEKFDRVARGELKRLIINMPPRHTKSEFGSWLLPAWFLGKFPTKKIIQASNTAELAAGFGRRVRNMIDGEPNEEGLNPYREIFPNVLLAADSKAAASWHTNRGGEYFAIGVNGKVTGKGADIFIIDDPHSEQEAKQAESDPDVFDSVYDWYTSGPRQRLQPGGVVILIVTRWSKRDLAGRLIKEMQKNIAAGAKPGSYDHWEVLTLPAILDEGTPTERSMWPGFWPIEELQRTRAALDVPKWKAQYQQEPTSEQGAIIPRATWRRWGADNQECPGPQHQTAWRNLSPPACDYVVQSWDCAATKTNRADYSACTTWGIFKSEDPTTGKTINNAVLLSAFKARLTFPQLKKKAKQFYYEDEPDTLLIENKNSGTQLIQEFMAMGIPVDAYSFGRGSKKAPNDKIARANAVADVFSSGYVWAPERRYADEVIEECAEFPYGEHDDYVDSVVQAMSRFRTGGLLRTALDADEGEEEQKPRRRHGRYY